MTDTEERAAGKRAHWATLVVHGGKRVHEATSQKLLYRVLYEECRALKAEASCYIEVWTRCHRRLFIHGSAFDVVAVFWSMSQENRGAA